MDPQARINALRQYMDAFPAQGNYSRGMGGMSGSDQFTEAQNGATSNAARMMFAQQMMDRDQQQAPDFFGSQAPQYQPPQPVQGISANAGFPLAPQDRQPMQRRPDSTQGGMAMNYLRQLFSR